MDATSEGLGGRISDGAHFARNRNLHGIQKLPLGDGPRVGAETEVENNLQKRFVGMYSLENQRDIDAPVEPLS